MVSLIGAFICLLGMAGFGMSTNLYQDFLGVSKAANDRISIISGLLLAALALYIS